MENKVILKFRDIVMEHRRRTEEVTNAIAATHADIEAKRGTVMQYTRSQEGALINAALQPLKDELPSRAQRVDDLMEQVRDALDGKYALRGEDASPDLQLLTGAFDLPIEKLKELHERHRDNPTMSQAIATYNKRNGITGIGFNFRTKEDELRVYSGYAEQAKDWMNRFNRSFDKPTGAAIMSFADDFGLALSHDNFDAVGDGSGLLD